MKFMKNETNLLKLTKIIRKTLKLWIILKKKKIRDKILIVDILKNQLVFEQERIEKQIECKLMNDSNKLNEENSIIIK